MSQGPMAMAEPTFSQLGDDQDDLPRTFRREKEAREREAKEREAKERGERLAQERAASQRPVPPTLSATPNAYTQADPGVYADHIAQPNASDPPYPSSVRRFDVPFLHLMMFFLKAVLAAIPALFLLGVILWFAGSALQTFYPEFVKMKILISFPNAAS